MLRPFPPRGGDRRSPIVLHRMSPDRSMSDSSGGSDRSLREGSPDSGSGGGAHRAATRPGRTRRTPSAPRRNRAPAPPGRLGDQFLIQFPGIGIDRLFHHKLVYGARRPSPAANGADHQARTGSRIPGCEQVGDIGLQGHRIDINRIPAGGF